MSTLKEDISAAINPAFAVKALLQGAAELLEKAEALPDPDGDVWAAREIVVMALTHVEKIYTLHDELHLGSRAESFERAAA